MSAQHTSGPWTTSRALTPDNTGGYDWSIAKDGKVIAEVFEHVGYASDGIRYDKRPAEANARLIAAAPELLAALEGLFEGIPLPDTANEYELVQAGCSPDEARRLATAVAAIASATGAA